MRAEGRLRAPGSPAPRSRLPRHAARRAPPRTARGLALALALATGLLAPLAAAPASAAHDGGAPRDSGSAPLDPGAAARDHPASEHGAGSDDGAAAQLAAAPTPTASPVPTPHEQEAPSTLTLAAQLHADDGGDAAATDWTLEAVGSATLRGTTGDPAITAVQVQPGAYALGLGGGRPGYAAAWACEGGALDGGTVTVGAGEQVACTVVLDDLPVDLALTLDDGDARAANGGGFGLTMSVRNLGGRDLDGDEPATLTAELPTGASVVSVPGGCAAAGGTVRCSIDPAALPAGGATTLAVGVRFDDGAGAGEHTTIATVGTEDDPAPAQPTCARESNGVDCETTELRFPTLTLVDALSTDDGGDAARADVALNASGPVTVAGVTGDPDVTLAPVPAGAYRLGAAGPAGYAVGAWRCDGGVLDGGTITIAGIVDVTCTIGLDDHPVDLRLAVDGSGAQGAPGGRVHVAIVVSNAGGRDVDLDEPVTVTDVLPASLTYVDGPDGCSAAGGTVTCAVDPASLRAGASVELAIQLAIAPEAAAGTYESRASVTTEDDPVPEGGCELPSDNIACTLTRVVRGLVTAQKSVWEQVNGGWMSSDGAVAFGDLLQFRIVVRAEGEAPSTGVGVVDRLSDGLLADGMASCSVPCVVALDAATGTNRIEIGTMAPGAVVTVTITARVPGVPSQADGTVVRVAFDSAAALSSDTVEAAATNVVTVRASHALPPRGPTGGDIPIGGISVALALLVAGGLLLVRSRELAA